LQPSLNIILIWFGTIHHPGLGYVKKSITTQAMHFSI